MTLPKTVTTSIANIGVRFRSYNKQVQDIWKSYEMVNLYMGQVHQMIKKGTIEPAELPSLASGQPVSFGKSSTYGMISSLTRKANPRRALIDAVAAFEHYLGYIASIVYTDYPGKLLSNTVPESGEREIKLLDIIVQSEDREQIIERIVEEKVRQLFYANPVEFFAKDRAKLELGDTFRVLHKDALARYREITARRNIIVHNDGRVDRKYLREIPDTGMALGHVVDIDSPYLRQGLITLRGIAAVAAGQVISKVYKAPVKGRLATTIETFSKRSASGPMADGTMDQLS